MLNEESLGKVAGKTLTRVLSEEQFERYRPWAENSRRLHDLVAELEQLSVISMGSWKSRLSRPSLRNYHTVPSPQRLISIPEGTGHRSSQLQKVSRRAKYGTIYQTANRMRCLRGPSGN